MTTFERNASAPRESVKPSGRRARLDRCFDVRSAAGCGRAILLATVVALALPASSDARRRPTPREAVAISTAALHTLHGKGWRAHAVRVSTVRSTYRYATASVDNSRTGVGGEMILRRTGSGWHRVFLGTDEFCAAGAPRAVLRDLGFRC